MDWYFGAGYPADIIEGVTVQMLVEEAGLKPMNAFIAMDWLMKDPEAAKFALTHVKSSAIEEAENTTDILPEDSVPDEAIEDV